MIQLASTRYIPVACNDRRLLRQSDAEGEFFRALAEKMPATFKEDPSRQGIYCFSADGEMLSFVRNMGPEMDVLQVLQDGLHAFERLPQQQRQAGGTQVPSIQQDPLAQPIPPPGGLVLRVYTRRLEWTDSGLVASTARLPRHGMALPPQPQLDHMWLTKQACTALIPQPLEPGASHAVPVQALQNLYQLHLADTSLKGDLMWAPDEMKSAEMTSTVESVEHGHAVISMRGTVHYSKRWGYRATAWVKAWFRYDRTQQRIGDFKMTALEKVQTGDRGQDVSTYVGIAFEQADGSEPGDAVPPHDLSQYMWR